MYSRVTDISKSKSLTGSVSALIAKLEGSYIKALSKPRKMHAMLKYTGLHHYDGEEQLLPKS